MKKEAFSVRFLYGNAFGRLILKVLTLPFFSKAVGAFLSTPLSKPMVGHFIKKHQLDMTGFENVKFKSFNAFFSRKRSGNIFDDGKKVLISPCDGHLSIYDITDDVIFNIKNSTYGIGDLLADEALASRFSGGKCLIFRLTPQNYHRYSFCISGKISRSENIKGRLHCVRPLAITSVPVFIQNSRQFVVIDTDFSASLVQMEVGALLVGKIKNHPASETVTKGDEKGYFEFGGSTIIVLLEKDKSNLTDKFTGIIGTEQEIPVILGETVGTFR